MADHKNEKKVQPSYSQVNSSKPKEYVLLIAPHSDHHFAKYISTDTPLQ